MGPQMCDMARTLRPLSVARERFPAFGTVSAMSATAVAGRYTSPIAPAPILAFIR